MSPSTNLKSPLISSRFSRKPVVRSSMIVTTAPCRINSSARFDPMNPAPPVTRTLVVRDILDHRLQVILTAHADVFKAHLTHVIRLVHVAKVCDLWRLQKGLDPFHIKRPKLVPL